MVVLMARPTWAIDGARNASVKTVDLSTLPGGAYQLTAGEVSGLYDVDVVDMEFTWTPTASFETMKASGTVYLFSVAFGADTAVCSIAATGILTLVFKGASFAIADGTETSHLWQAGDDLKVRLWWSYRTNKSGLRMTVNGCVADDVVAQAATAIAAPTAVYIGSNMGASAAPASLQATSVKAFYSYVTGSIPPASGLVLGDSIEASGATRHSALGSLLLTSAQYLPATGLAASRRIATLARGGDLFASQKTRWEASRYYADGQLSWICVIGGINNANNNQSIATANAEAQALATSIKTACPSVKLLWGIPTPCDAGLTAPQRVVLAGVRSAILGGTITGIDLVLSSYYAPLGGGTDNLAALYDTGDHIHQNESGQDLIKASLLAGLVAVGIV